MTTDRPILVYVTTIPLSMNRFFEKQLSFMRDHGFNVAAVASPGPMLDEVGKREQVAVYGIPMNRRISPFSDLVSLIRLVRLFRTIRPTIVNASTPKAGLLGTLAAGMCRVPVRVLVLHGLLTARRMRGWGIVFRLVSKISCLFADSVLSVSNSVAEGMIEQGLCRPSKIKVLGAGSINGIDTDLFDPGKVKEADVQALRIKLGLTAELPVIGYVGRLSADKGIDELLQAWHLLRRLRHDTRLLLIGPLDNDAPVSPSVLDALTSDPHVIMTDFVAHEALPLYYSLMQVFVLPSYREGFPLCLLEASAMGIPIVATRVTGCVDAVRDGITGTLVPVHDPQSLADAPAAYLQNPDLAREHGRAGRDWVVRDFQPERIWDAFRQEYVQLMRDKCLPSDEPERHQEE
ncbi:MAG: glycosyltransferase family 4 protein [Pseudomonadota bacterium]